MPDQPADAALAAALKTMRDAFDAAVDIASRVRGYDGYRLATQISHAVSVMAVTVGAVRADRANEVADDEALTLRGLADRISVSKARAQRFRERAERGRR